MLEHHVAPVVRMFAPDGSEVSLNDVTARVERRHELLVDLWVTGELTPVDWARTDAAAWFHLAPEVRGPLSGGAFDPVRPVRIEIRLAPEHATVVGLLCETVDEILAELRAPEILPALQRTESWYALRVTQDLGPVRAGFRTVWADAT